MPIDFRSQFAAICCAHGPFLPPSAAHFPLPCRIHHARVALCADGLGCAAGNTQPIDSRVRARRFDGNVCRLFRVKTYPAPGSAVGAAPSRGRVSHCPPIGVKNLPFFRQPENPMSCHKYPTFWPCLRYTCSIPEGNKKHNTNSPNAIPKAAKNGLFRGRTVMHLRYQPFPRPEQPPKREGGSAGRAACGQRWGGPRQLSARAAARRAIDGERGGGTIGQRWADPSHQPRAHRRDSPPPPRVQSRGAAWGGRSPRPQARPLLRHTGAGRAWLSRPQAASRDRAFWAGLRRGRAYGQSRIAARAAAKLRPCADALAAAWAGWEAG